MAKRDLNNKLGRKIKKAEKKLKKLKVSVAKMREEMTQWANLAENPYKAIVEIREMVHQLTLAAESSNAKLGELISAWLPKDDDD